MERTRDGRMRILFALGPSQQGPAEQDDYQGIKEMNNPEQGLSLGRDCRSRLHWGWGRDPALSL